jgi:RsiW-degrading membrane proteinase PrsW (M82 family)
MFYIYLLGILPSLVWLSFYLKKDAHPESNKMILKIFLYGLIFALWAIVFEKLMEKVPLNKYLDVFLSGPLIEEFLKYLAVRIGVFRTSELDEPFDLTLYMIIAGLGFAALENILVLGSNYTPLEANNFIILAFILLARFLTATFLHAICSGMFGYFLGLSFYHFPKRKIYFWIGFLIAFLMHGFYNFSFTFIKGLETFIIPGIILLGAGLFLSKKIPKLRYYKGICKINETI